MSSVCYFEEFLRHEKKFAQRKFYVILKIIPSAIYIRGILNNGTW